MTEQHKFQPEIGILGTGRMGRRIAAMFATAGRRVLLGSRDPEKAQSIAHASGLDSLRGGTNCQAARAPIVLPAIFIRDGLFDLLDSFAADLSESR